MLPLAFLAGSAHLLLSSVADYRSMLVGVRCMCADVESVRLRPLVLVGWQVGMVWMWGG